MKLTIDELAPLTGKPPSDIAKVGKRAAAFPSTLFPRRRIFKAALAVGGAAALNVLGVLPPARRARADGYDIRGDCGYDYSGTCGSPCGPSDGSHDYCTYDGWHLNDGWDYIYNNNGNGYVLRPNECTSSGADGWRWRTEDSCWPCSGSSVFQCHDGWKYSNWSSSKTICEQWISC